MSLHLQSPECGQPLPPHLPVLPTAQPRVQGGCRAVSSRQARVPWGMSFLHPDHQKKPLCQGGTWPVFWGPREAGVA